MDEELKRSMVIQFIRDYKNKNFTDEEIEEKYPLAIEYMLLHFNDIDVASSNGAVKSISQGERSVTYKDTNTDFIRSNRLLTGLLGRPYMGAY